MGLLQVDSNGVKLDEGESEFLLPLYAEEIHSRDVCELSLLSFPAPLIKPFSNVVIIRSAFNQKPDCWHVWLPGFWHTVLF